VELSSIEGPSEGNEREALRLVLVVGGMIGGEGSLVRSTYSLCVSDGQLPSQLSMELCDAAGDMGGRSSRTLKLGRCKCELGRSRIEDNLSGRFWPGRFLNRGGMIDESRGGRVLEKPGLRVESGPPGCEFPL